MIIHVFLQSIYSLIFSKLWYYNFDFLVKIVSVQY